MEIKCPVCESDRLIKFLERQQIPIMQNLPFANQQEAKKIIKRDMQMYCCQSCDFIFNAAFKNIQYEAGYVNSQEFSTVFARHIENLVDKITNKIYEKFTNKEKLILVEIGCGQGKFLKKLVERINLMGNMEIFAYGFDPAYVGASREKNITFVNEYFSEDSLENIDVKAEDIVILSRHVIEHIQNLDSFMKNILNSISRIGTGLIFLETPQVDWIIERNAFEDFCYEHCSYFSKKSLKHLLEKNFFKINEFEVLFNGQYMLVVGEFSSSKKNNIAEYANAEKDKLQQWSERLKKFKSENQTTVIWGAGAKGVIFANLLDPDMEYIKAIIDINPDKQGKYLAGTGHQILGIDSLKDIKVHNVIVMNENYYEEIKKSVSNSVNNLVEVIKL